MNRNTHVIFGLLFLASITYAAEEVDAEILKDLDFFKSLDFIQDDAFDQNLDPIISDEAQGG